MALARLDTALDAPSAQMPHFAQGSLPSSTLSSVSSLVATSPPSMSDHQPSPSPTSRAFLATASLPGESHWFGRSKTMSMGGKTSHDSTDAARWRYDPDPFASNRPLSSLTGSGRPGSSSSAISASASTSSNLKKRGSLLSKVPLTSFVSRRRKSLHGATSPQSQSSGSRLSDVIEITASASSAAAQAALEREEEAERERLRDEAAQSIGLGSVMLEGSEFLNVGGLSGNGSFVGSFIVMDEEAEPQARVSGEMRGETASLRTSREEMYHHRPDRSASLESSTYASGRASRLSVTSPSLLTPSTPSGPLTMTRRRAGSLAQSLFRSRTRDREHDAVSVVDTIPDTDSTMGGDAAALSSSVPSYHTTSLLPAFPCSCSALKPVTRLAGETSKYTAPSRSTGGLGFSRKGKNVWKSRYIVLSRPLKQGGKSYLHLFKSSGSTERELDRMEIDGSSAWLFKDDARAVGRGLEHVDGPPDAARVDGLDVGGSKDTSAGLRDSGRVVWIIHFTSPGERARWKEAVEDAVASRRSELHRLAQPITPTSSNFSDPLASLRNGISTAPGALLPTPLRSPLQPSAKLGVGALPKPGTTPSNRVQGGVLRSLFHPPSPSGGWRPQAANSPDGLASPVTVPSSSTDKRRLFGKVRSNSIGGRVELSSLIQSSSSTTTPPPKPIAPAVRPLLSLTVDTSMATSARVSTDTATSISLQKPAEGYSPERSLSPTSLMPAPRPARRTVTSLLVATTVSSQLQASKPSEGTDRSPRFRGPSGAFGEGYESDGPAESSSLLPPSFSPGPESPYSRRAMSFTSGDEKLREDSYAGSISSRASIEPERDRQSSIGHSSVSHLNWSPEAGSSSMIKRWSRAGPLPKMAAPPTGPPPTIPGGGSNDAAPKNASQTSIPDILHPYATAGISIDRPPSRGSITSNSSGVLGGLPKFRRLSSSSMRSANSSIENTVPRTKRLSRQSLPPPRPPPSGAPPLPPTASTSKPNSPTTSKVTFRDAPPPRSFRRSSLIPPPPPPGAPPSTDLPPRPTERNIRRLSDDADLLKRNTAKKGTSTMLLYTIPGSPVPDQKPVPSGPLPPVPTKSKEAASDQTPTLTARKFFAPTTDTESGLLPLSSSRFPRPLPSTPIGEPIIAFPTSADFFSLGTPTSPGIPIPLHVTTPPTLHDTSHSFISLSPPPPRRNSRHIIITHERDQEPSVDLTPAEVQGKRISRQDSAVSLGFISM